MIESPASDNRPDKFADPSTDAPGIWVDVSLAHARWWMWVMRILGALLGLLAVAVPLNNTVDPKLAIFCTVLGLALFGPAEYLFWRARHSRARIRDAEIGFDFEDRHGLRFIADDQVLAISIVVQEIDREGEHYANSTTVKLWIDPAAVAAHQPDTITLKIDNRLNAAFPLGELLSRITDTLGDQALKDYEAGRAVSGDGWTLQAGKLTLVGVESPIAVDDLAVIELHDGKYKIWRDSDQDPIAALDPLGRNAALLGVLLAKRSDKLASAGAVGAKPSGTAPPTLGRKLAERHLLPSGKFIAAGYILGAVALLVALAVFADVLPTPTPTSPSDKARDKIFLVGVTALCVGLVLIPATRRAARAFLAIYTNGVVHRGFWRGRLRELRFDQMIAVTVSTTKTYSNGIYTGTTWAFHFEADSDSQAQNIRYNGTSYRRAPDLERLRDMAATAIAGNLLQRLASGEPVVISSYLTLEPPSAPARPLVFRYNPNGVFRAPSWQTLPLDRLAGYNIDDGYLSLFEAGQPKAVFYDSISNRNMWPLLVILSRFDADASDDDSLPTTNA